MARIPKILLVLVLGLLALPLSAYLAASRYLGPYGGSRGVATYLGALYSGALGGNVLALVLLFSPGLVLGAWLLRARLLARWRRIGAGTEARDQTK